MTLFLHEEPAIPSDKSSWMEHDWIVGRKASAASQTFQGISRFGYC